jgi:hypothetical protein
MRTATIKDVIWIHGQWCARVIFHDYPLGMGVCPYKVFEAIIEGCNEVDARTNAEIVVRAYRTPEPAWVPV